VKAVNLIPGDARRHGARSAGVGLGPSHALLGLLAVAVALVTVYVLTSNTISSRKAELAGLNAQLAQEQARAATLASYQQFEKLAQARAETVRQIAATRFDWYRALADLSKVVPADTSLGSLFASVAPGSSGSGAGSAGTASSLRGDIAAPALQMTGCTKSQDDVARLMSRLRLINGVTRVTLGDSQKQASSTPGTSVSSSVASSSSASTDQAAGCGPNTPTFDLVVFFRPLAGGRPTGPAPASSQPVSSTAAQPTAATSTTTSSGGSR
jgi:Tfp pilus assembly protein PilN